MSLTLYYAPQTRAGRVRWLLEELEVPYTCQVVDRAGGECDTPAYRAVHPLGKIPALKDGEQVIYESSAILLHLADRFPDRGVAPVAGSVERGLYYQWVLFMAATVEPAAMAARVAEGEAQQAAMQGLMELMGVIGRALEGREFLVGERFTVADVAVGSGLLWATAMGWLKGAGVLEEYAGRLAERPAYQRAQASV